MLVKLSIAASERTRGRGRGLFEPALLISFMLVLVLQQLVGRVESAALQPHQQDLTPRHETEYYPSDSEDTTDDDEYETDDDDLIPARPIVVPVDGSTPAATVLHGVWRSSLIEDDGSLEFLANPVRVSNVVFPPGVYALEFHMAPRGNMDSSGYNYGGPLRGVSVTDSRSRQRIYEGNSEPEHPISANRGPAYPEKALFQLHHPAQISVSFWTGWDHRGRRLFPEDAMVLYDVIGYWETQQQGRQGRQRQQLQQR
ncbi:MAG: hypothetical protein M1825_001217 [Sarcosagium campestre]|nr:MAG: hypothetical protein M1825_001217 [Sarcosagium campestre]